MTWFRWRNLARQARRWMRANHALSIAARCMFHLNRAAKDARNTYQSRAIYALKTPFVEWLYQHGYCIAVRARTQTLNCWTCRGTGEHWTGTICRKCWGTGTYRTHKLYQFVFAIHGRTYVWHQPAHLVQFDVMVTDPRIGSYDDGHKPGRASACIGDRDLAEFYYVVLYEFLRLRDCEVDPFYDLRLSTRRHVVKHVRRFWDTLRYRSGMHWLSTQLHRFVDSLP